MLDRIQSASRSTIAVGAIILALILFLSVNLIASLALNIRVDATDQQLYSVSDDTRTTLGGLKERITLRLYLSSALRDSLPSVRIFSQRVIELLRTYENLSRGKLSFELIDPTPLSVAEDEAVGYGVLGVRFREGEIGYFGLVGTNTVDGFETVPYLNPDEELSLEYDLTRLVARLSSRVESTIGVVDGLGLMQPGEDGRPSLLIQSLDRDFNIVEVPLDFTHVREDVDALLIIHPFALSPQSRYAIDQFVIRGGPVLVFLDVQAEHSLANPNNPAVLLYPESYLANLLAAWGVEMVPGRVAADPTFALSVTMRATQERIPYLPWFHLGKPLDGTASPFSATDPVSVALVSVRMSSSGVLRQLPGATTTFTPLITTSASGALVDLRVSMARDPSAVLLAYRSLGAESLGQQVLAARVTGVVSTAYPEGPPPPPPVEPGQPVPNPQIELMRQSDGPISVIIVADTDMVADDHVVAEGLGLLNNDDFVTNALESLVGGTGLTLLRVRGEIARPFIRLTQIERRAEETYRAPLQEKLALQEQAELDRQNIVARVPGGLVTALPIDQQDAVADLDQQIFQLRREARAIEAQLTAELNAETLRLRLLNILVVPLVVILVGLLAAIWRRVRLARYLAGRRAMAWGTEP